jgi:DNA polymerase III subunit beta
MEIIIQQPQLHRLLSRVQAIVERKSTNPMLVNVLLVAEENELRVYGSDLEMAVVAKSAADVFSPGRTAVNAKVLSDIVRELPDAAVTLRLSEGQRLEIHAQNSRLIVVGMNPDEYPQLSGLGLAVEGRMQSRQLLEMLHRTLYAVSTEETTFNLNGVCFEPLVDGKTHLLRLAATDGHRLALATRPVDSFRMTQRVIAPRKGLSELRKLLDEEEHPEVRIDLKENYLLIETDSTKVAMRLIDGEFPDYNQVVPQQPGVKAMVKADDFIQALRRVSLLVTERSKCVRLDFFKNQLRIASGSSELGDAVEELEIVYDGEPISVGFNARYLMDTATNLGGDETLIVELHGLVGPGKFYLEADESCLAIVMPMRL